MKPRLLDLFCGAGGAAVGYDRAGVEVVGVDINPQPNYPYEFHQADALEFMGELLHWEYPVASFDAIHASPPCQGYSQRTPDQNKHPRMIGEVRDLLKMSDLPYVIENVRNARSDMVEPVMLCGSSFGLRVQRHRLFESNFPIKAPPCDHAWQEADKRFLVYDHKKWFWTGVAPVYGSGGRKAVEYWPSAMGCGSTWDDCWMTRDELAEAIPPAFTEFIGQQLISHLYDYSTNRLAV